LDSGPPKKKTSNPAGSKKKEAQSVLAFLLDCRKRKKKV